MIKNQNDPFHPIWQFFFSGGERLFRVMRRRWLSLGWLRNSRTTRDSFSTGQWAGEDVYTPAARSVRGLSSAELDRFRAEGWIGPFSFMAPAGVRASDEVHARFMKRFVEPEKKHALQPDAFSKRPWLKSMHAYVPEFYDICRHPAIVERVSSILGPDVMAWGLSVNLYHPGKTHAWHVDFEHRRWQGVTVFLGLRNITLQSTLKVLNGSHRVPRIPPEMKVRDDESALAAVRQFEKDTELVTVPINEGDFFIFDGPLWHGSKNESLRTRRAMIIQYSRPDQRVQVPLNWVEPIEWHSSQPPCVLVKGEDRWGINRMVERPERF